MLYSNLLWFAFLFLSNAFKPGRLPSSHPVTVHTLCLNTNTAHCCSAYISQPLHACWSVISRARPRPRTVTYSDGMHAFTANNHFEGGEQYPFHFQRKAAMTPCERMAGFPCKQGNSPISPFSNWRVLTKHSCMCLCDFLLFLVHIPDMENRKCLITVPEYPGLFHCTYRLLTCC